MRFSRLYLNRLQSTPDHADTVVVIDVLRSFTTAAVALARGASVVHPVDSLAAAVALAAKLPAAISIGAVGGGDPAPGFDYGNSPARLSAARLTGQPVVMSTAAGVQGLQRFRAARSLFAASLVCASATAQAIRSSGAQEVCFVITGEWVDRDGDEDVACADFIEALLRGERPDPAIFSQRVRQSDFGRRFVSGNWPNLPLADLDLCASVDLYDFALPVHRENDRLAIR